MKILLILFGLLSFSSFAQDYEYVEDINFKALGGWASGGGNAVVCFYDRFAEESLQLTKENNGQIPDNLLHRIRSIEMYDNFEARLPRGLQQEAPELIEISEDQTIKEWALTLAERFNRYVPSVGQNIYAGMAAIPDSNIRFFSGPVKQVNDVDNVIGSVDKKRCLITTIAIQRNFNNFYNLYIDSRLFNHSAHTKQSKATLLLHEYIYAQGRKKDHENSAATRELVGLAMTRHPDFTIDYGAFLVHNLNFGYGVVSENLSSRRAYYIHTALIDMAIWRTVAEKKNFVHSFMDSKCLNSLCASFISMWNKSFPLSPIRVEDAFLKIFEMYEFARSNQVNGFFPQELEVEMRKILRGQFKMYSNQMDDFKAKVLKQINVMPDSLNNKDAVTIKVEAEFEKLKDQVEKFLMGSGTHPREVSLFRAVNEKEELLQKEHQVRWLMEDSFFTSLLFDTIIP